MRKFELFDYFPNCNSPSFDWDAHNRYFDSRNVIFHAKTKAAEYPEHWGCLSVKTVISGVENFFIEREKFALTKDKYLILNHGQHYGSQVYAESEVESFTINYTEEFVALALQALLTNEQVLIDTPDLDADNALEFIQHFHDHDGIITPALRRIYSLSQQFQANYALIEEAYFDLLKALLAKQTGIQTQIQKTPGLKNTTRQELFRRLVRGKEFIESNFDANISLNDMAQVSCLSIYHFLESFNQVFGCTPYQYLIRVRLKHAKQMLECKDISVQEVCQSVGYDDVSSFSKLYKKTFGISPSKVNLKLNY